jgi:hypothetical protein
MSIRPTVFSTMLLLPALVIGLRPQDKPEVKKTDPNQPALYDAKADAVHAVAEALRTAKKDQKRVLIEFGANW